MIGRFDGESFTRESSVQPSEWGRDSYAGQTWNDAPDGRRLFISWMAAVAGKQVSEAIYPDMPFNQQMSFPREFSLRSTPEGIRLSAQPVREIAKLYSRQHRSSGAKLTAGANPLAGITGELFDIEAEVEMRDAKTVKLDIRGTAITFDAATGSLACLGKSVSFKPVNGHIDLRAIVDRTSIEIFAAGGRYVMSFCFKPDRANRKLSLTAEGGTAMVKSLHVRELKPALPASGL
jgi:fructan beta-fructosidase